MELPLADNFETMNMIQFDDDSAHIRSSNHQAVATTITLVSKQKWDEELNTNGEPHPLPNNGQPGPLFDTDTLESIIDLRDASHHIPYSLPLKCFKKP